MMEPMRLVGNTITTTLKWASVLAVVFLVAAVLAVRHSPAFGGYFNMTVLTGGGFLLWKCYRAYSWWMGRRAREVSQPAPVPIRTIDGKVVPQMLAAAALAVPRISPGPDYILRGLPDYGKALLGLQGAQFEYAGEPEAPIAEPPPPPTPAPQTLWERLVLWYRGRFQESGATEDAFVGTDWGKVFAIFGAVALVGAFIFMAQQ